LQSCLMQDEPEGRIGFSYKMSLEREGSVKLGIDRQHARWRETKPGADPGADGGQP
jgi:hypothetical protein